MFGMYRSNYDWDNYFGGNKPSYEDWLFNERLAYNADKLRERQAMEELIKQAYLRQYYKNHRYDAGGIMGGIASTADLVTDIAGDWQTVKNSGKQAEADIKKNVGNESALNALTSGNLYDTSSVDAFMKSSSAAQSNLANVRDATMNDAGGKENAFLNGLVASNRDALKGGTAGAQFGGPWGAAIGGIAGGIAGAVTGIFGSKKINKKRKEAVKKYNKQYNANSIQQMYANSQANAADAVNRKQQLAAKANLVARGGNLFATGSGTFGNKNFGDMFINVNKDIATELPKLMNSFGSKGGGTTGGSGNTESTAELGNIASSFKSDTNSINANGISSTAGKMPAVYDKTALNKKPVELGDWKKDYTIGSTSGNNTMYNLGVQQGSGNKYHPAPAPEPRLKRPTLMQQYYKEAPRPTVSPEVAKKQPLVSQSTKHKTAAPLKTQRHLRPEEEAYEALMREHFDPYLADGGKLSHNLENPYRKYLNEYFADSPYINEYEAYNLGIDDLDIEVAPSIKYYIDKATDYQKYLDDYQRWLREGTAQAQSEQQSESDAQRQAELWSAFQQMRLKQQELNDYRSQQDIAAMLDLEQADAEQRKKYETETQKQINELYNRIFQ